MTKAWAVCKCFQQNNIFLREFGAHVSFTNRDQFLSEFGPELIQLGCKNIDNVVKEVEKEVERRANHQEQSWKRKLHISQNYEFKHPEVKTLSKSFLDKEFLEIIEQSRNSTVSSKVKKVLEDVYSFPVLTKDFCKTLIEEIQNFKSSNLPCEQPNSMNKHGLLMFELGLDKLIDSLRSDYLQPLSKLLYPEAVLEGLDSHKAFTVEYQTGGDVELATHFDNAEVTLNVCLEPGDEGGELCFGQGLHSVPVEHEVGRGVLHLGSQLHSAMPLQAGRRNNLIIWMRSSAVRNISCPMCRDQPNLQVVEHGTGEGFTVE